MLPTKCRFIWSKNPPLKPLSQMNWILVGSIYGRSSIKLLILSWSINKHGRHRKFLFLISRLLKIFSSETSWPKLMIRNLVGIIYGTRREQPTMGKQLLNFITFAASRVHPFCNLQSRARTHAVLVIGLYELLGNPIIQLIELPGPSIYM
jgi:hypothetical protein